MGWPSRGSGLATELETDDKLRPSSGFSAISPPAVALQSPPSSNPTPPHPNRRPLYPISAPDSPPKPPTRPSHAPLPAAPNRPALRTYLGPPTTTSRPLRPGPRGRPGPTAAHPGRMMEDARAGRPRSGGRPGGASVCGAEAGIERYLAGRGRGMQMGPGPPAPRCGGEPELDRACLGLPDPSKTCGVTW